MEVSTHNNVTCAKSTVKMFGVRLNVYIYIDGGIMIDTGPVRFARQFSDFLNSYPVEKAVLTHYHEDHSGNAPIMEKKGIPIYINDYYLSLCKADAAMPFYRRIFWGRRRKFHPYSLPQPPGTVESNSTSLETIYTPGHSPDHIAFYNPQKGAVFTGDLFVTPKTKFVMTGESIPQTINSLQKVLGKDFSTVYCGHAGVVENGREMLHKKIDYLQNLQGEVLDLYKKGMDIKSITRELFPKKAPIVYMSAKEWSSEHIVYSIIKESEE